MSEYPKTNQNLPVIDATDESVSSSTLRVKRSASGQLIPDSVGSRWSADFEKACGVSSTEACDRMFAQLLAATSESEKQNLHHVNASLAMLTAQPATDPLEAALRVQMIAVHDHAMKLMTQAIDRPMGAHLFLGTATRLLALYARQLEVLGRYRRKGTQKVVVERINIETGGQAIVGHVAHHRGG